MVKSKSFFIGLGASNHSDYIRVNNDFYSTDPKAIDYLLKYEKFDNKVWECACGNGNLAKRLEEFGYEVHASDLVDRGYGDYGLDFLKQDMCFEGDIITNPPYKYATEFVEKALELTNRKVAMFFKIQFLESIKRYERLFMNNPPKKVLPFVKRIECWRNDDRSLKSKAICYAWFVWDKEYMGKTMIEWIDNR